MTAPTHPREAIPIPASPPETHHSLSLSLQDAHALASFALREAETWRLPIVFSVVNASGQQRCYFSMDNALLVSHTLAGQKAFTAVSLKMPTCQIAQLVQPGASLYGLQQQPGICCIGGGIPFWSEGRLLGAIGVSGGTAEQDHLIAENTLNRFSASCYPLTAEA